MLEDLGQVLKMSGAAKRMYTGGGQEVRSFSQLRNEFAEIDTFYLGTSMVPSAAIVQQPIIANNVQVVAGSPIRRSRSRAGLVAGPPIMPIVDDMGGIGGGGGGGIQSGTTNKMAARQRARSKSRPRVLYAPENEIVRPSGGKYTMGRI